MRPRHIVMATGVSGIPNVPDIPSLKDFAGTGPAFEPVPRRRGLEGQARDRHRHRQQRPRHRTGSLLERRRRSRWYSAVPTLIVNIEPSAQLAYTLYDEGPPLDDCDLLAASMPLHSARKSHQSLTEQGRKLDKPLLDRLEQRGFKLDFGEDGTGWQFKYLTRGGGYYFNVGCSDLLAEGKIALAQFADIERFVAEGARIKIGEHDCRRPRSCWRPATRARSISSRKLFGDEVAARVGPIWGFGGGQELRNMFMRTPQPGLWFIAGSLAQCRIYSKYLGLQIKAIEAGLLAQQV